jgi:gluconokinase
MKTPRIGEVVVVLMGVSGCGKTTVGEKLAGRLGCPFYDGDDFHPPENVARMARGQPLDDDDRAPWLDRLNELIHGHLVRCQSAVVACSALKKSYRDRLRAGNEGLRFVHLQGSFDLIRERMQARPNHYMKADMLQSQFDALEAPADDEAFAVSIDQDAERVVDRIMEAFSQEG